VPESTEGVEAVGEAFAAREYRLNTATLRAGARQHPIAVAGRLALPQAAFSIEAQLMRRGRRVGFDDSDSEVAVSHGTPPSSHTPSLGAGAALAPDQGEEARDFESSCSDHGGSDME
jgi:hypothetical protein